MWFLCSLCIYQPKLTSLLPLMLLSMSRRWKVLFPHEVPLLRDARKVQKAALVRNFVDRESERPALGPGDFLPLSMTNCVSVPDSLNPSMKQKTGSR